MPRNRFLEEKEIFDSLSELVNIKLSYSTVSDIELVFGKAKFYKIDHHDYDICFKSKDISDKMILIFGFGHDTRDSVVYTFRVFQDGLNYKYLSKCNISKKVIKNIKVAGTFSLFTMDKKEILSYLGIPYKDEFDSSSDKKLIYNRTYFESIPLSKQTITLAGWFHWYTLTIDFNKNNKVIRVEMVRSIRG